MAFPVSPINGQIHGKYKFNSTKTSWELFSALGSTIVGSSVNLGGGGINIIGSTVSGAWTDTGASITLTPGTYRITTSGGSIFVQGQANSTGVQYRLTRLRMVDSTATTILDSQYTGGMSGTTFFNTNGQLCFTYVVSSTTTYKTQFGTVNNSDAPTIAGCYFQTESDVASYHKIYAERIA